MNFLADSEVAAPKVKWKVDKRPVLITGGAGFIGCNVADWLLTHGQAVIVYDNLSRPGVDRNLAWLEDRHGSKLKTVIADIRDQKAITEQAALASKIFHFAAQVAVTTSIINPVEDFEINARGTFNVIEALRGLDTPPPLLFTSTNKVYGRLEDIGLRIGDCRYEPTDPSIRSFGISETRALDFHSPYGCSKGAADQYVLDSARSYGLKTVVFRMSCIYGPRQFGTEDQGWVAHFLIRALSGKPVTLYGDGCQVRDILFVDDLVNAMLIAHNNIDTISGSAFNIGGGETNTISLLDLLEMIEELTGNKPQTEFEDWRIGDQRYYVSDTRKFENLTNWSASVSARDGIKRLYQWLKESHNARHQEAQELAGAGRLD